MNFKTSSKFFLLSALYFSQGIPNGFFRHTVPVIFRDSGVSLEQIALFYPALYAPWMLKFIWSIFVERFHSEKQGKYRSWIIPLQILTAGVMVALANWEFGSPISIFVLAVALINIFSSIQDISTDGYAVELLGHHERGWGNAIQVGTFWVGYVVGGGVILMLLNQLGWNIVLVAMSVVTILSTIPILLIKRSTPNISTEQKQSSKKFSGLLGFLVQPNVIKVLTLVATFRAIEGFIRSLLPTMFKDWGMKFEEIGLILGVLAPVSAMVGALFAGFFINRIGRFRALMIFGSMQIFSALGYMLLSNGIATVNIFSILPVVVLDHIISGMTTVALFSLMMDWSRKRQGGTDYTAMDCIGVFAMMLGASVSYFIASQGGYSLSFGLGIPIIAISIFVVRSLYLKLQNDARWKNTNNKNSFI